MSRSATSAGAACSPASSSCATATRARRADELGAAVTGECLRCGLSMNIVRSGQNANCLRMAPPLSVTQDEIDLAVEILDGALRTTLARTGAAPVRAR